MFTFFATKDQLPEPRRKVLVLKRIRAKPLTYANVRNGDRVTASKAISRLNDIARSNSSAAVLEKELAAISLRDLYQWKYSETVEVERAIRETKKRISTQRGAEKRSNKVRT